MRNTNRHSLKTNHHLQAPPLKALPQTDLTDKTCQLASDIVAACQSAKAQDITVLDMDGVFDMTDYFVVVSGRSDRHTQGIGNKLINELESQGLKPQTVEGMDDGQWILIDYCDVVVHIFYGPVRNHYDIEGLWINAKKVPVVDTEGQIAA